MRENRNAGVVLLG